MSEPTKGPYRLGEFPARLIEYPLSPDMWDIDVRSQDGDLVCRAYGRTKEQAEANARLFAAAEEMREAIHKALMFLDRSDIPAAEWYKVAPEHVAAFRAALAKADGK